MIWRWAVLPLLYGLGAVLALGAFACVCAAASGNFKQPVWVTVGTRIVLLVMVCWLLGFMVMHT